MNITKNVHELSNSTEFFMIAISMLENAKKTNIIPELMTILTPKQIIAFSQIFGGGSINIPTAKELSIALKSALYVYQTQFLNLSSEQVLSKELDVTEAEREDILEYANSWISKLQSKTGSGLYSNVAK